MSKAQWGHGFHTGKKDGTISEKIDAEEWAFLIEIDKIYWSCKHISKIIEERLCQDSNKLLDDDTTMAIANAVPMLMRYTSLLRIQHKKSLDDIQERAKYE